jgi:hypothetical protein
MSNTNTVADLNAKNKGRFDGFFHIQVNTLVIMSICMALTCNLTVSS